MSNLLSENWQYATLAIIDDLDHRVGTGVLVADATVTKDEFGGPYVEWQKPATRAYLVTARHVLGENASVIETTANYGLAYNVMTSEGIERRVAKFFVSNNPSNWAVHPDEHVDIAVLDVSSWVQTIEEEALLQFCPLSELANPISLAQVDCDAGDDVFVLGYPLKLRQGKSNLPIVRKGVLASSPRRSLHDEDENPLRGFLVDGAIMPGSSGSPVISASTRFTGGDLAMTPHRPLLLGIVSQEWGRGNLQRYDAANAPARSGDPIGAYANLGLAYGAATVCETIEVLGHHTAQDVLRFDHDTNWSPALGIPEWALEFDGKEVDSTETHRIMMRLHRDRMRAHGSSVTTDDYFDAIDILGPVSK